MARDNDDDKRGNRAVEVVLLPPSPQVRALQLSKAKTDPPSPIPLQTRPSEIPSPM
jgi:hypothetical protein